LKWLKRRQGARLNIFVISPKSDIRGISNVRIRVSGVENG
jgi:hypothetical protein